jgi:hypothetical protein
MDRPNTPDDISTVALVRDVLDEGKELLRLEIALAKEEARRELKRVEHAAVVLGFALAASVLLLCMLATALVLALGGTAVVALLVAAGFLVIGCVAGAVGYTMVPKSPFGETRRRLESNVNQLKEHLA